MPYLHCVALGVRALEGRLTLPLPSPLLVVGDLVFLPLPSPLLFRARALRGDAATG